MIAKKARNFGTIKIGGNEYDIFIAKTEELKSKGLQNFKSLPKDQGMLFVINEFNPIETFFHMHNVPFPLDLVFMDEDLKVLDVKRGEPEEDRIEGKASYVLEINAGSGVKEGDEADLEDEDTNYAMKMLAPDGSILFLLEGGERIFSRISTKKLIRKALKAEISKDDKDYKSLGKMIFRELKALDTREPEYVTKKENGK